MNIPSVAIYSNGMVKPAPVSSTAWDLARQTGALSDAPLELLLAIAPADHAQDIEDALTSKAHAERRLLEAYCSRDDESKLAFVAALIGREVTHSIRRRSGPR